MDIVEVLQGGDVVKIIEKGSKGDKGDPGLTASEVTDIVRNTIHGNAPDDGIAVDATGNIRLSIGTLQTIP